jgi:poly(hydroxyalkanoate) depolymerase family esterase
MNMIDSGRMAEATRLTRAGRLAEATALLQGALGGAATAPPADGWQGPTLDLRAEPLPEASPGGEQWLARSHANPFGRRDYRLFVPAAAANEQRPLLVMLHGCTQNPDDFAAGTAMNRLAAGAGLIVAWPGQCQTANPQRCWNWFQPTDQERARGEPSIIAGITREVMRDHSVDAGRVYVAGLSAGGAEAAVLAATYPDVYAAFGVHSGLAHGAARDVASAFQAMREPAAGRPASVGGRKMPVIVVHGDRDATVHPGNGAAVIRQAVGTLETAVERGRVPNGHAWTRTRHLDQAGQTLAEHWQVHGLGHAWSGGNAAGSYTDPRGPDASRAMLDFFLRHRNGPAAAG